MEKKNPNRRLRIQFCILVGIIALTVLAYALESIPASYWGRLFTRQKNHGEIIPHWRRFTNNECGYVVEFPSRPFESPYTLSNRQNVISYRQFASALGSNQAFMVATLVTSLTNTYSDEQINSLLDIAMQGALGTDGKLFAQRDIILGTNVGREFELVKADGYFAKMRFYQVGHNLQELIVRVPLADKGSTNIPQFLDSFNLISK